MFFTFRYLAYCSKSAKNRTALSCATARSRHVTSRLSCNNAIIVQSCNNNSSTKDPVASEFLSPNHIPDKLNPISIVQSFGPKQHNEPKIINPLNLKQIGSLPLINLSKSPKHTASRYSEGEKKINNSPNLELTDNLHLTDLPKRPSCTADRNGGMD